MSFQFSESVTYMEGDKQAKLITNNWTIGKQTLAVLIKVR